MRTAGPLLADTPNTDLQLFISAAQSIGFNTSTGAGTFPTATSGVEADGAVETAVLDAIAVAASSTVNIKFNLTHLLVRTGILQSQNYATNTSQQAFGTAEGPGPNSTFGTSDPSGMGYGELEVENSSTSTNVETSGSNTKAPVTGQFLPTLAGPLTLNQVTSGVITKTSIANPKGIRVKWIDLLYQVSGVALTSLAMQLGGYVVSLGHDNIIILLNDYAVNTLTGAALAINSGVTKIHRERCTITDSDGNLTTQFLVNDGTILSSVVSLVTPSGSTAKFVGLILGCDYNLN
ncbi:MAG TPA: hypothetical protein VGF75_00270 [Candidatus Saccharimonadales bacterium]|jgi:hypothetical protein